MDTNKLLFGVIAGSIIGLTLNSSKKKEAKMWGPPAQPTPPAQPPAPAPAPAPTPAPAPAPAPAPTPATPPPKEQMKTGTKNPEGKEK